MQAVLQELDWPIRTDRLLIRPAAPDDVEAVWAYRRRPTVTEWMTTVADDRTEFGAHFAAPDRLAKTLLIERSGAVIGDLMLALENAWSQSEVRDRAVGVQAEVGWCLHPDHAGQGYATEAVRALLRLCFTDLGLRRVTANCFAANTASVRVMERVGMRREAHTVRDSLHRSGHWLDGLSYALLAAEWSVTS